MKRIPPKGAVAAGHEITVGAAADMLRSGGNAFDATLAALFASCVCEPVLSSLGGGGFLMAYDAGTSQTSLFDFFVQTPTKKQPSDDIEFTSIHADFGTTRQEFQIGMGACAVPGFVAGCFAVHETLCALPMDKIAAPAIAAAENGVVMNGFQSRLLEIVAPILLYAEDTASHFAPMGSLLRTGEVYRNPQFAETLKTLVTEGKDFFYGGAVRDAILALTDKVGGHLSPQDFSSYEAILRAPLVQPFGVDGRVFLNPSPSAGGCLVGFGLALAEQMERDGMSIGSSKIAEILQATDHSRIALNDTTMPDDDAISCAIAALKTRSVATKGTTHISVIDAQGNAASATVSNGSGNGHMVPGFGFMLNNILGEEDLNPNGFHQWQCGERVSSMMSPTILHDEDGSLGVLGSGGSSRIRSAMLQVLLHLKSGAVPQEAVKAARLHTEGESINIENWFDEPQLAQLLATYPEATVWSEPNMFFGGVHMVQRDANGQFDGAGDMRRDGFFMVVD